MSDVKGVEPKPEVKPADPPAAKPTEPKPADAAPVAAKVADAKPAEAKPAPAKPEVKPEAKPAAAAAPAPAPAAAKPAAPAPPAPGTVGVRAPAPQAPDSNVNIQISMKAALTVVTGLVMAVVGLGVTIIFLLNRINDRNPLSLVQVQKPGMDGAPVPVAEAAKAAAPEAPPEKVSIGSTFKDNLGGKPSSLPGTWPNFRGPKYDNIVSGIDLANRWPKGGPPVKWTVTGLGQGYSGAAVFEGRVYLQDYETGAKEESLRCFSLDDGKEIWRRSYVMKIVNSHGFTRTVPAVTAKHLVMAGSMCHVMCLDPKTGDLKWAIDMMAEYGTQSMAKDWYSAQCPLIDGSTVVLAPCGTDVLMMGVDLETGKPVWKTPNPDKLQLAHSSISPMTLNGKKQYVYCAEWGTMVGVSAEKENVGELLWKVKVLDKKTISPCPAILDDGHIFMTAGYSAGSAMVKITEQGGKYEAAVLWKLDEKDGLCSEQQTPIYFNKHLFGLMPDSSGARKQQLVCMNPYDKGKVIWESGNQKRFGQWEAMLLADGKFFVLDKDSSLTLVKASTEKYEELGRCKLLQGIEAWAPIALAGNFMILRDNKTMICIDVGKGIE